VLFSKAKSMARARTQSKLKSNKWWNLLVTFFKKFLLSRVPRYYFNGFWFEIGSQLKKEKLSQYYETKGIERKISAFSSIICLKKRRENES